MFNEFMVFSSFPNNKFRESSKLKELQTTISKLIKNSRKFSRQVENTVGKGEIAHYLYNLVK